MQAMRKGSSDSEHRISPPSESESLLSTRATQLNKDFNELNLVEQETGSWAKRKVG